MARLLTRWKATIASLATFGGVGAIAFVVDIGVYNLLRATVLEGSPIWSKVASVAVATVVAWIGNRLLTFRATRGGNVAREAFLFAVMNVGGLLIAAACLFVSHYVLGFTSQLADNISGNGIGLVLGTAFRYLGYRYIVFRPAPKVRDEASDVKPQDPINPDTRVSRTSTRTTPERVMSNGVTSPKRGAEPESVPRLITSHLSTAPLTPESRGTR